MTGKVLDSGASGALILLLPVAFVMVVLFTAWPAILLLIALSLGWRLWQHYQWKQWCEQVDPFFHQIIRDNRGYLTPMDLSLKTKLTGRAAKRFLDKKAEEYGAQYKEEDKGRAYYFLTASALGNIFDDSEPLSELDELESETHSASASSAVEAPQSSAEGTSGSASARTQLEERPKASESESLKVAQHEAESEAPMQLSTATESADTNSAIATTLPESEAHQKSHAEELELSSHTEAQTPEASAQGETDSDDEDRKSNISNGEAPPVEETPLSSFLEGDEEQQSASESDLALIQAELAKRLDLHSSTIGKRKSDPDFSQWSQSRDPQGIAWQYVPETKMFVPLEEPESS